MKPDSPEACDRLFAECIARGDLDGVVALYESGASFVRPDGTVLSGVAAIRIELAPLAAAKIRFDMDVRRIVRAGDDLAVLYNAWTVHATGPDGAPATQSGHALEMVRRQPDGTWRFVVDDPMGWSGP